MLTIRDIEEACNRQAEASDRQRHVACDNIKQELSELEKHNGWPNRETWLVHLWLTNDANYQAYARECAEDCDSDMEAGEQIRDRVVQPLQDSAGVSEGLLCGLVNQAMARVDWERIGEAFREK